MNIDENDFFRQMTLRICGSLNIQSALERSFSYLRDFIPLSMIRFGIFDPAAYILKVVASFGVHEDPWIGKGFVASERIGNRAATRWVSMERMSLINQPATSPFFLELFQSFGINPNSSTLIMRLEMDEDRIGALAFMAEGTNRYTMDHAQLVLLVHDPFAIAMSNALKHHKVLELQEMLEDDNRFLHSQLREISGSQIIGADFGLREVMEKVRRVAPMDSPVLLQGETGVGKEVIANAIHAGSARAEGPLITVNCGAIAEQLIDSELFGHEKGAFTGAVAQKRGRFERAHKGTIFLDEIGELPPQAQVRLLHVLQNKLIERVGGTSSIKVDIRIISATHRNLRDMLASEQFREDLWFRLNVFPIKIPPLRERKEDIPALVSHFLGKKKRELRLEHGLRLAPGAMENLMHYDWPGNVRELENVIERALIQHHDGMVSFEPQTPAEQHPVGDAPPKSDPRSSPAELAKLDEAVAEHIRKALAMSGGKISGPGGAADLLGLIPNTLRKKMDKLAIKYRRRQD